jgi:hypothetical protein
MKKGMLSIGIIQQLRRVHGICPICGSKLPWNPRTRGKGQWAHFLCDTKPHLKRYGKEIIGSNYNGLKVCSLKCNNSVQLNYKSQPVLCDELAEEIRERLAVEKEEKEFVYG